MPAATRRSAQLGFSCCGRKLELYQHTSSVATEACRFRRFRDFERVNREESELKELALRKSTIHT